MPAAFEIQDVLQTEGIIPVFQPIVSLKRKKIIGFEALSRGIHPQDHSLLPPLELFERAAQVGKVVDLDRLCRKKILESFRAVHQANPNLMLSLNYNASVIDEGEDGSSHLLETTREFGIDPGNICIEIIESNVTDMDSLKRFVAFLRENGFLIALDDVGMGHSNLNRIPLLKPDIIKIDRYLAQGIHGDFHKQQVFKSVVSLCRSLGAAIIAEGVETGQEALEILASGVEMIQGYYFAKPLGIPECLLDSHENKIHALSAAYKDMEIRKVSLKRFNMMKYHSMIQELQAGLSAVSGSEFDEKLGQLAEYFPNVECFFVLNENGVQVTETFLNTPIQRQKILFQAVPKGTDHSMKDYFYMLMEASLGKIQYITEPYLSQVTGNICVTFAALFKDAAQKRHILCADINTQDFSI